MDFTFNDYASFKLDNDEIIKMIESKNDVAIRFKHVYDVLEYVYNLRVNNEEIEPSLLEIFEFGFDYLFDQVEQINNLITEYYGSINELNKHAKTVNLLLYVEDYLNEAPENHKQEYQELLDRIYDHIKKGEDAPMELFGILNDLNYKSFGDDFQSSLEIFSIIAYELDLLDDDDEYIVG